MARNVGKDREVFQTIHQNLFTPIGVIFATVDRIFNTNFMSKSAATLKGEPTLLWVTNQTIPSLIVTVRQGIKFSMFSKIMKGSPFTLQEWSRFLHLSERSMQRYKAEKRTFDPIYSEKILEITFLYQRGVEVFGDSENFNTWLSAKSIALGGVMPKELMDTTFGINLLNDELTRIEHGILA